jgi:hypothetical protein
VAEWSTNTCNKQKTTYKTANSGQSHRILGQWMTFRYRWRGKFIKITLAMLRLKVRWLTERKLTMKIHCIPSWSRIIIWLLFQQFTCSMTQAQVSKLVYLMQTWLKSTNSRSCFLIICFYHRDQEVCTSSNFEIWERLLILQSEKVNRCNQK